jgi:hypothetical protein
MKHIAGMITLRHLSFACLLTGALASCDDDSRSAAAQNSPAQAGMALSRTSNAKLGDLTLVLSNYLCQDPTGSGALLAHPARTGQLASYSLAKNEQSADTATVAMEGLKFQIPLAGTLVLVEVIDHGHNIALYGKLVAPAALAGLKIAVPETPLLASCANPG